MQYIPAALTLLAAAFLIFNITRLAKRVSRGWPLFNARTRWVFTAAISFSALFCVGMLAQTYGLATGEPVLPEYWWPPLAIAAVASFLALKRVIPQNEQRTHTE